MKPLIRRFDVAASQLVALLPSGLHKPFDMLGYATAPPVWAFSLIVYIAASIPENIHRWDALAVLIVLPLAGTIKYLFRRDRPPTIYAGNMKIKSYSFPSSHAYCAALGGSFFGLVAFQIGADMLGIALFALIAIIGFSRVHIGAHYPSDVIAGWLLGGLMTLGIVCIL